MVTPVRILEQYHVCTVKYNGGLKNSKIFAKRHIRTFHSAFKNVCVYTVRTLTYRKNSNFLQPFLLLQEKHDIDVWCKQYFIIFDKFYVHFSSKGCSFFVLQLSKCKKSKSFKMVIHHSFTTLALAKSLFLLLLLRRRQNIEMRYGISSCPK